MKRTMMAVAGWCLGCAVAWGGDPGTDAPAAPAGCCGTKASACAAPKVTDVFVKWEGATLVYESAPCKLRIEYLQKGTRSEGQNGILLCAGAEVAGTAVGQTTNTPLGELKWYGTERKNLWDNTGWNFADKRLVKPSSLVKPSDEKKADSPVTADPSAK
jgi:hypothetical protein